MAELEVGSAKRLKKNFSAIVLILISYPRESCMDLSKNWAFEFFYLVCNYILCTQYVSVVFVVVVVLILRVQFLWL